MYSTFIGIRIPYYKIIYPITIQRTVEGYMQWLFSIPIISLNHLGCQLFTSSITKPDVPSDQ